jgi:hypothetical protein
MTRLFHISDILSVHTGVMLVFKDALTRPDGSLRPAYRANIDGIIDVIAHVSGNALRNPANPGQFDRDKMMHLLPHVQRSLEAQHPWLKGLDFPDGLLPADREAAQKFCDDWIREHARIHGAWLEITEDPDIGIVHTVRFGGPQP